MIRLTIFFLTVCFLQVSADVYSQTISLNGKDLSLLEVFDAVYKQTGYAVSGANSLIDKPSKVSVNVTDMPLEAFLTHVLKGKNLEARIEQKTIVLFRPRQIVRMEPSTNQPTQQRQTISGSIRDSTGQGIANATISLPKENLAVATDENGFFLFSQIPHDAEVQISCVGYQTVRFSLLNLENLPAGITVERLHEHAIQFEVRLQLLTSKLDDVVVTGYMDVDRGHFTGSAFTLRAEDIKIAGETSIDQMLQGVVPGMLVTTTSGQVGAAPRIRVRGTSTILGNQEPVWVVDGVIQRNPLPLEEGSGSLAGELSELRLLAATAISWLNPNDIETITVLKDASATAIYGSQAANGVIVINTKKARPGTLAVSYSTDMTIGSRPRYEDYNLMNSWELMQFSQEIYQDRESYTMPILPIGYGGLIQRLHNKEIDYNTYIAEYRQLEQNNTDWFDILFHNPVSHNHNLTFSGGTEHLVNRTGVSYQRQIGEARGNELGAFTASSNTTLRFGNKLTLNLMINGGVRHTEGFAFGVNPFQYAYNTSRTIPSRNNDGTLFFHEKRGTSSTAIPGKSSYLYNIERELDNTGNGQTTRTLVATADLRWRLLDGLDYQGLFSYNANNTDGKSYATEFSNFITQIRGYEFGEVASNSDEERGSRLPFGGLVTLNNANNLGYTFRNSVIYHKLFAAKHTVTAQLGVEARSNQMRGSLDTRYGYLAYRGEQYAPVPRTPALITNTGAENLHEAMRANSYITNTKHNFLSEYMSAVYGYDSRYVVNFNARLDASNRFGQDQNKKFAPTWSVGAKWRAANEPFFQQPYWLGMLDFYGSYGYQGNAVESVSPFLIATDGGLSPYFNQYILTIRSLPYPDLGWEKTRTWNFGMDLSLLNSRLNATFNLYQKRSNILASREVPVENGVSSAIVLGSEMENKGYDLIVNVVPVRTNDVTWQFSVNTGIARNRITQNQRINTRDDFLNGTAIVNGEPYSTFYSYAYDGLDATNGRPTFRFMDITPTDNDLDYLVKSGKLEPDFAGGLSTSIRYKHFSLRAQFAMAFGAQKRLPAIYNPSGAPTPEQNVSRILLNRWKQPGDELNTDIPSIPPGNMNHFFQYLPTVNSVFLSPYTMYQLSDLRVADADFIRCRAIGLSYDIPATWLNQWHCKRLLVSVNMTNPFLIAFDKRWDGYDPETGGWPARQTNTISLQMSF